MKRGRKTPGLQSSVDANRKSVNAPPQLLCLAHGCHRRRHGPIKAARNAHATAFKC